MDDRALLRAVKSLVEYIEARLDAQEQPASDNVPKSVDSVPKVQDDGDTMSRVKVVGMTSEELVQRRKESGLTQAQVAEKLGVSHRTIVRWEAGSSKIDQWKASELRAILLPGIVTYEARMRRLEDNASRWVAKKSMRQVDSSDD